MRNGQSLAATALALALAGCSGMGASECRLADWQAVGYGDGARGRPAEAFGEHHRRCARHEVAADFAAYQQGRAAGLREYCQPQRGYSEGLRGVDYQGGCPADLEAAFYASFLDGHTLYLLESAIDRTRREMAANEARMDQIERELAAQTTRALAGELTPEAATSMLVRARQLAEERLRLADENDRLEARLTGQQEELDAYRATVMAQR